MSAKDIPNDPDETGDEFFEDYSYMEGVALESLSQLCKERGLDPTKASVEAFNPYGDRYSYISLYYSRTLSKSELEAQERERQAKLDKFEKDIRNYETAKEKYKIATAEYNLWKAQQRVEKMRSQSETK